MNNAFHFNMMFVSNLHETLNYCSAIVWDLQLIRNHQLCKDLIYSLLFTILLFRITKKSYDKHLLVLLERSKSIIDDEREEEEEMKKIDFFFVRFMSVKIMKNLAILYMYTRKKKLDIWTTCLYFLSCKNLEMRVTNAISNWISIKVYQIWLLFWIKNANTYFICALWISYRSNSLIACFELIKILYIKI